MKKILLIIATLISTAVFAADLPSPNALMDTARQLKNTADKLNKLIELSSDRIVTAKNFDPVVQNIRSEANQFKIAALQSIILQRNPQIDLRDYRFGPRNANPESRDELSETIATSYMSINVIIKFFDDVEKLLENRDVANQLRLVRNELASVTSLWGEFVNSEFERFRKK